MRELSFCGPREGGGGGLRVEGCFVWELCFRGLSRMESAAIYLRRGLCVEGFRVCTGKAWEEGGVRLVTVHVELSTKKAHKVFTTAPRLCNVVVLWPVVALRYK